MAESPEVPSIPDACLDRGAAIDDWQFCWERLTEVSRTFSRPIRAMSPDLRTAATCGYLLCRVADTIEDHPELTFEHKRSLFRQFLDVVERDGSAAEFTDAWDEVPGAGPYHDLARGLPRVMEVYDALPEPVVRATERRVGEMARGMLNYERRREWRGDVARIETLRDLERYCYYVAGTVGHMLTDLFVESIGSVDAERRRTMRANAERFGLGLQMVNILKDQTDDRAEGWCFVPRLEMARRGLDADTLFDRDRRDAAHRAVAPIFERASEHLDAALEYTLALPPRARRIRAGCLIPLWLAVRTLVHARGNDAMFEPDAPVKISRDEVLELTSECVEHAADDTYLRKRYDELWQTV